MVSSVSEDVYRFINVVRARRSSLETEDSFQMWNRGNRENQIGIEEEGDYVLS